jgi:hypothetical protein
MSLGRYKGVKIMSRCKKDNKHYGFLTDLVRNYPYHETKIGSGIDYFSIGSWKKDDKPYIITIHRTDGSSTSISWKLCCQFKTPDRLLTDSMRSAVSDFIAEFRNKSKLICQECQAENKVFHVDHVDPQFRILKRDFLEGTSRTIPEEFVEHTIEYECMEEPIITSKFKTTDKDFMNDWIEYHNKKCNLQILCRPCNMRKSRSK